ncbi:MAG: metal-dependent hydrolase [Betaproteobacteria bacterium]|nr:metal-dependent hydrolase [Betaproteobacteria bacterium]
MDSASQFLLGAAVGVATLGRRTAPWKAALWGGIAGTAPDLDSFIDHGDAIAAMTLHRAESHALFWLTLCSPLLAALPAWLHGERAMFKRWWLAMWLALITHPLLDAMTVYGTQLFLPFTNHPVGLGSVFIIDPMYTLPLLIGVMAVLAQRNDSGRKWNTVGLVLSTLYLVWGAAVQSHVESVARASLPPSEQATARVLVTPSAFNSILWRVVVRRDGDYAEGFYSLFDRERRVRFQRFPHDARLEAELKRAANAAHARMAAFTHGFYALKEDAGRVRLTDLRMGQEPYYTFAFHIAERENGALMPVPAERVGSLGDVPKRLAWLWERLKGKDSPPPR